MRSTERRHMCRPIGWAHRLLLVGIAIVALHWPGTTLEAQDTWTFTGGAANNYWSFNGTLHYNAPVRFTLTQAGPILKAGETPTYCSGNFPTLGTGEELVLANSSL